MKKIIISLILGSVCLYCNAGGHFITHCDVTTYNPVKTQCNNDNLHTADMTEISLKKLKNGSQRIVAISRDLLWCIPLGSVIEIEGIKGRFVVHDKMNARFTHRIDICKHPKDKNFKLDKVKVKLISKPKSKK